MKYLAALFLLLLSPCAFAQTVNLIDLQQPAASPVEPGTTDHEVLQFRLYKNSGSAASEFTEIKVDMAGTAVLADWDAVHLYHDADGSRTINAGDQHLATATTTLSGKATLGGFSEPIADGFSNGRDYLVVVDVNASATVDNDFRFTAEAADVSVTAGTVNAPFGTIISNDHTIRIDNGAEMDVSRGGIDIPSSTQAVHHVGYISTSGGSLTFDIDNTGTGQLDLTGSPLVEISQETNCAVTVTTDPNSTVGAGSATSFVIGVTPATAATFTFRITIPNSDFDEHPYVVNCEGSAAPIAIMDLEYNSSPVANGGSISVGSNTAGIGVPMTFTIYNTGNADLDLTATPDAVLFPVRNNVQCSLTSAPTTPVASGSGSTSFTIEFTPIGGAANFDFAIQIPNSDSFNDPYYVVVDGSSPAVTPTQLSVFRLPGLAQEGVIFGQQPTVTVTDSNGAVDLSNNGVDVEVTLNATNGASLSGTTTRTSVNGYVSFTDLRIDTEGTGYTLTFTDISGTLGNVTTPPFNVGPPPPEPEEPDSGGSSDDDGGCSTGAPGTPWMLLWGALAAMLAALRLAGRFSEKN